MSELTSMTLAEARDALAAKTVSSRELTGAFVAAIEAARPLGAFITETAEKALAMADASDKRRAGKILLEKCAGDRLDPHIGKCHGRTVLFENGFDGGFGANAGG